MIISILAGIVFDAWTIQIFHRLGHGYEWPMCMFAVALSIELVKLPLACRDEEMEAP